MSFIVKYLVRVGVLISFFFSTLMLSAQSGPVRWTVTASPVSTKEVDVLLAANVDAGWHIYALGDSIQSTRITFDPGDYKLMNAVSGNVPHEKYDSALEMQVAYFEESVMFKQRLRLTKKSAVVTGRIRYMACSGANCLPPKEFEFFLEVEGKRK